MDPRSTRSASNLATGAAAQYLAWGQLPGGSLPATRAVALFYPASAGGGLLLLGFVLLLTPTGTLPSPGWRWWASARVAVPLLLVVLRYRLGTVASGPKVPPADSNVEPLPVRTAVRSAQSDQSWASPMAFRSSGGGRRFE